jgi:2-phospho-L-lactate guanylyltransferase
MIALATDLPLIAEADLSSLESAAAGEVVVIAPDRSGAGTNALALAPPDFTFHFGPNSFTRHVEEAERRGLQVRVLRTRGLSADVDGPADLWLVDALH